MADEETKPEGNSRISGDKPISENETVTHKAQSSTGRKFVPILGKDYGGRG